MNRLIKNVKVKIGGCSGKYYGFRCMCNNGNGNIAASECECTDQMAKEDVSSKSHNDTKFCLHNDNPCAPSENGKLIRYDSNKENDIGTAKDTFGQDIANCVKPKNLEFSHVEPPECELPRATCSDYENVMIKDHVKGCSLEPKQCPLMKMGCEGCIINQNIGCSRENDHGHRINNVLHQIDNKLQKYEIITCKLQEYKSKEEQIMIINSNMKELKEEIEINRDLYKVPKSGILCWKINYARAFLDKNVAELSTPVYTNEYGYKLCLKVYSKGDGIGKGTHLSIYFVVMKGRYDDLLPWPFKKMVKITLYNRDVRNLSRQEIYKPNDNIKSFNKPESEFNAATGNPTFIELNCLQNNGFIIDDSIFIELSVERERTIL